MATLAALLVLVLVAVATFTLLWLVDRRIARARIIKEGHTAEEELSLFSRSARESDLQKMLTEADINIPAGNFLGISAVAGVVAATIAYVLSGRVEVAWIALLVGFVLPYSYASIRRNRRK
jgi:Flp pilus assembly protein TadB